MARPLLRATMLALVLLALSGAAALAGDGGAGSGGSTTGGSLAHTLARIMHSAGGSNAALVVLDGARRRTIFAHRAGTPRILASNTKLFTTAAGLARFGSRIARLLKRILLPSNNQLAQALSNRLGHGSPGRGAREAARYARSLGAHAHLVDGSGLSRRNQAAPQEVVDLLRGMERAKNFRLWAGALPRAGVSGTLRRRMRGTSASHRCTAKTGTLVDVSTLSGYCRTLHGHRVIFSILMNRVRVRAAQAAQDRMLAHIVRDG